MKTPASLSTMFASSELHKLIASKQWHKAHERIKSHKAEVFKIRNCEALTDDVMRKISAYPLHNACYLKAPGHLVLALLDAYPRAVQIPDTGYKRLPVHHAMLSGGFPNIVMELLNRFPESAMVPDTLGRLPIHYAMFLKVPIALVDELIRLFPAGVKHQDCKGWTPLHLAGVSRVPLCVVRKMVSACPEALEKIDSHTFCPRDFYIVHDKVTMEVIDFLVLSTPKSMPMNIDVKDLYKDLLDRPAESVRPDSTSLPAVHPVHPVHPRLQEPRDLVVKL